MLEQANTGMIFSPRRLGEHLLLSDPGFVRLRMGIRALLTTGLVCTVLALLHPWLPMPAAAYAIAMISAIQGVAAIKDTTIGARAVTRVYAAISGFCVIAALTLIDRSLLLVNVLLLVVIFLAVYARRFSARWQAVGMFAFMCGVVGAFLKPKDIDLEAIALSLCLSGFIAHQVRNVVLPERPDVDCRRAMKAASALVDRLSNEIVVQARMGWTVAGQRDAMELERHARDAILLCESYLPVTPSGTFADERAAFLAMRLFDLHLAMESALSKALAPAEIQSRSLSPALQEKLKILQHFQESANAAMAATPAECFSIETGGDKQVTLFPRQGEWLADKTVRQAFQVTTASAIAMAGGVALSPERWFWAVLTAFLVFSNTQSRGDLAVRALNRTLGTAVGICVGIGLATLIEGELYLTIGLVGVSIFAAFYLASLSYSALTFFITIAIALVYGLIGVFTPALLVLRLEETVIGVAAGIFVSLFVLPVSTLDQTREAMDRFLNALDALLGEIIAKDTSASRASLVAAVRRLDATEAEVRAAVGPMQSPWAFGMAQEKPRRALMRVSMLVHAGHILAREFGSAVPSASQEQRLRALRTELAELTASNRDMSGRSRIADMAQLPELNEDASSSEPVEYALRLMGHVLRQADTRNQE